MNGLQRFDPGRLRRFCGIVLEAVGVSADDANLVADCLVTANLQGVDTHGLARLSTYVRRIRQGAINPSAVPSVASGSKAAVLVDGQNALGPVAGMFGMKEALTRAAQFGISYVGVRNSNHFSYAAYYCEQAARAGMVGICSSGGEPTVAPWGGVKALFTNSPIALAAPTSSGPVVVDLATSVTSRGNVMLAKLLGESIPEGWALDANGQPTTDPVAALAGSVLPMGGAKGYALIVALEVLNGVLTGGAFAPRVGSQASQDGTAAGVPHCFIAIDPDAMTGRTTFIERMDRLVLETKDAPRSSPERAILMPGERRASIAAERSASGIPLPQEVVDDLRLIARQHASDAESLL